MLPQQRTEEPDPIRGETGHLKDSSNHTSVGERQLTQNDVGTPGRRRVRASGVVTLTHIMFVGIHVYMVLYSVN